MKTNVVGERIKYERQRMGLTQEELGNSVSVSKNCIGSWETGRTMPDIFALNKLAAVFTIEIKDFLVEPDSTSVAESRVSYITEKHDTITFTDKEITIINKIRALSRERRKAVEVLFGIR